MLQNLRVFSENPPQSPELIELVDISTFYPKEIGYRGSIEACKERIPQIIEKLRSRPIGERAVEMKFLLAYEMYPDKGCDPLAVMEKGEVDVSRTIAMLKPLSKELKKRRIPIDVMYLDNEGGFGYYELKQTGLRKIFRSARAKRLMPPECRVLNPDDFNSNSPNFIAAKTAWDVYAVKLKYDALRKVIVGSGLFDIKPSKSQPAVRPSAMNFWSVAPSFPIYDYNGWRLDYTSLDGISSGPSCYVGNYGSRFDNRQHHPIWNNMIGMINQVRSCLGRPNARVHPVLSNPSFCAPWIWEQMVAHMVRSGISWTGAQNAFIYWNANSPTTEDPIAAQIMLRHDLNIPAQRNLPEIQLDTDIIQTGNWTTTYEEFLDNMADYLGDNGGPG